MPLAKLRLRLWWASHKQCVHSFNNEYFWITDTNNDYRKINCKNAVWWNFSELGSLAGLFTIRKDVPYNSCLRLYVNTWCGSNWLIQGPYFMWELSVVISRRYTPPLSVCGRVSMYDIQATASNMSQNKGRTILFRTPSTPGKGIGERNANIRARSEEDDSVCVCVFIARPVVCFNKTRPRQVIVSCPVFFHRAIHEVTTQCGRPVGHFTPVQQTILQH